MAVHHYRKRKAVTNSPPTPRDSPKETPTPVARMTGLSTTLSSAATILATSPVSQVVPVTNENLEERIIQDIAKKTHIPMWGVIVLFIIIGAFFLCTCFCCFKRLCRRKKKDSKKGLKGAVDLKSVQILGGSYKEKVQPDLEDLQDNMECNDVDQDSAKSDMKLGRLQYKLDYDFNTNNLAVTVIQAEDLPGMDMSGTSDPYVKVYLLPDKKKKYETKVHRKTLNPVFNETFNFKIPYSEIASKTLVFAVFDFDRFSKHDQIGEVKIPLNTLDLAQTIEEWKELTSVEGEQGQASGLLLSFCHEKTLNTRHARGGRYGNEKFSYILGVMDPYVKIALMLNGKRIKKKKTSIKKCTLNPYYNESFTFEVPFEQIQKVQLVVTVVDYDRIGTSEPIGKVVMGCNASGTELRHWMDMLASPRRPIAQWHSLKDPTDSMDN
ncbi:unnamed protein product [Larinioides sclopetarius]|uniref:C2 domain-containing protein n=1 Tax=Larinioides sclopetarius TaxID=280406 RepID=A0AAV1YXG8_9ARAC